MIKCSSKFKQQFFVSKSLKLFVTNHIPPKINKTVSLDPPHCVLLSSYAPEDKAAIINKPKTVS